MDQALRILALEPYYGGSHRAFIDGWGAHSRHQFTVLGLPPNSWKWRMRHAPATFARQVGMLVEQPLTDSTDGPPWDLVFCSDMLNLPEFLGLARRHLPPCPAVVYFHENQLTYPVQPGREDERDLHFGFTNLLTASAADAVWFNSAYHRDTFLAAGEKLLARFADHAPEWMIQTIGDHAAVHPPGIILPGEVGRPRSPGPLRIVWAARWEHDKNPDLLRAGLQELERVGVDFRISVIGQLFRDVPDAFRRIREEFADRIDHWGYQKSRDDYEQVLAGADVFLSTADHEFFGISVIEGLAAGAFALVPECLAYPETLAPLREAGEPIFHDGTPEGLAQGIGQLAERLAETGSVWTGADEIGREVATRYIWDRLAPEMDDAVSQLVNRD